MAMYNNGFPMNYNYYQQPQPQQMMNQPVMPQQLQSIPQQYQMQPQQPQQQMPQYPAVQGGFVRVRNENEARMYPVAPGNSVTFIDEITPYCYTKTVNMGQLDRPIFEKYRLVKEEDNPTPNAVQPVERPESVPMPDMSIYITKDDMAAFRADLDAIRADLETFRGDLYGIAGKKRNAMIKKESADNE